MKLSVSITAFNVEHIIAETLRPLQGLADEILVMDSLSTDNTPKIAAAMGATVISQPWQGYIKQKSDVMSRCKGEWILALDSDEVLGDELVEGIRAVLSAPNALNGYSLIRRTFYMGKLLKYAWQPDRKLRLVRRSGNPRWAGNEPHDYIEVDGKTGMLPGYLAHYSYRDFSDHMRRTKDQAQQIANTYFLKGRKSGAGSLLFKPPFMVFKRLILQRAFLDGAPGVMAAISSGIYAYMKYAYLWEMNHNARNNDKS